MPSSACWASDSGEQSSDDAEHVSAVVPHTARHANTRRRV